MRRETYNYFRHYKFFSGIIFIIRSAENNNSICPSPDNANGLPTRIYTGTATYMRRDQNETVPSGEIVS